MAWLRQLARASRNLGRVARQNPVWAIQNLVFAPLRFARHLLGVVVLMLAVAIVLILGTDGLIWYFGLARYPTLVAIVQVLVCASSSCSCRCDRQLLFLARQRPIIAAKLRYYAVANSPGGLMQPDGHGRR